MPFTIGGDWIPSDSASGGSKSSGRPVKVRLEKRRNSVITVILNLNSSQDLGALSSDLKKLCGCGGTVKEGVIELQGDRVDKVRKELTKRGLKPQ